MRLNLCFINKQPSVALANIHSSISSSKYPRNPRILEGFSHMHFDAFLIRVATLMLTITNCDRHTKYRVCNYTTPVYGGRLLANVTSTNHRDFVRNSYF